MTKENWKSIRVKEDTHSKIKAQAATLGISVDQYMALVAELSEKEVSIAEVRKISFDGYPTITLNHQ